MSRRIVVVASMAGAPGVTTCAVALAAAWPVAVDGGVRPVVVEADVSGGDLMIRFGLPDAPSLLDVASSAGRDQPGSLLGAVSELPCGVRVVASVPGRGACRGAVRLLAGESGRRVLRGDDTDTGTVLLDVGRAGDDTEPLIQDADQVVLVTRGGPEALTQVSTCGLDPRAYAGRLTLLVVGPCPYPAGEIADVLRMPRVVVWPWDARSVAALSGAGRMRPRTAGPRARPLMAATDELVRRLTGAQGLAARVGGRAQEAQGRGGGPGEAHWSRVGLVEVPGEGSSR
ncbi:hypothetical protein [Streptomyces sp. NPDC102360]|uniref:hypothetical protein n=1 Tax=Streptomyces sp. NPDC102360 TaxID=3366160 RepID=UPI00380DEF7C